jgi:hypothetical protein
MIPVGVVRETGPHANGEMVKHEEWAEVLEVVRPHGPANHRAGTFSLLNGFKDLYNCARNHYRGVGGLWRQNGRRRFLDERVGVVTSRKNPDRRVRKGQVDQRCQKLAERIVQSRVKASKHKTEDCAKDSSFHFSGQETALIYRGTVWVGNK